MLIAERAAANRSTAAEETVSTNPPGANLAIVSNWRRPSRSQPVCNPEKDASSSPTQIAFDARGPIVVNPESSSNPPVGTRPKGQTGQNPDPRKTRITRVHGEFSKTFWPTASMNSDRHRLTKRWRRMLATVPGVATYLRGQPDGWEDRRE